VIGAAELETEELETEEIVTIGGVKPGKLSCRLCQVSHSAKLLGFENLRLWRMTSATVWILCAESDGTVIGLVLAGMWPAGKAHQT
jgi:hypothetical protein